MCVLDEAATPARAEATHSHRFECHFERTIGKIPWQIESPTEWFALPAGMAVANTTLPGFQNLFSEVVGAFPWSSTALAVGSADGAGYAAVRTGTSRWKEAAKTSGSSNAPGTVWYADADFRAQVRSGDGGTTEYKLLRGAWRLLACRPDGDLLQTSL